MTVDLDRLSSYDFALPEELIAQQPAVERTGSRLLVLGREAAAPAHRRFADLAELLSPGDLLVVNDTSVVPARLFGEKAGTGGKVECLLVRKDGDRFICLLNASKRPKPGARLLFEGEGIGDALIAEVEGPVRDEPGAYFVRFMGDVLAFARAYGHVPLPPYITRDDVPAGHARPDDAQPHDALRYQTVYADPNKAGSSAAPTAGLHFDAALLAQLEAKGVQRASVTLHVGPGTFLPVRDDTLSAHVMHAEPWWVSAETARAVAETKARGGRVVCVGTTSLRALESSADASGVVRAGSGLTRLFIRPGTAAAPVRSADALVTNFHLPKSTLLVLVCAFAGWERVHAAYRAAIAARYRFFSYGDACFFERHP